MAYKLTEVINFRGDRLFNGAVDIDWFSSAPEKSRLASEAYVFHGPRYHGVAQEDVGNAHGHTLIDSANFTRTIINRTYGDADQPFTLAIAGYGTGKSHLGLTLANLVSAPESPTATAIIEDIHAADAEIAQDIQITLKEYNKPCLTLALNGMHRVDLAAEVTRQLVKILKKDGHSTDILDDLRPRFGQAIQLINLSNESIIQELLDDTGKSSPITIISELENQEETTYALVHDFFDKKGMSIRTFSNESVKDVIDIAVKEYCGPGKPYHSLLIVFDEFGKYIEFATLNSQLAGGGALQDLFEGIQANAVRATFVGFIQFELNTYIQRIAPEYKNEILRYITRYQSADKLYLSVNLETLMANLLEKSQPHILDAYLDDESSLPDSQKIQNAIQTWFPRAQKHRLWKSSEQFHRVIRKGCWPLSPYATWLLYDLTAEGRHLQARSALALLGDAISRLGHQEINGNKNWAIPAVEIWSETLLQDLLTAEDSGQNGSITHSFTSVISRHGTKLQPSQITILQAIVLSSKLGMVTTSQHDATQALSALTGIIPSSVEQHLQFLQEEYNVIEWDDASQSFDIIGDAVPRAQFLSFIRQRVASTYDENGKAALFARHAKDWCPLIKDLESDFANDNHITSTKEWRYTNIAASDTFLPQQIKLAADRWRQAIEVDAPKGTVIYTYASPSRGKEEIFSSINKQLRTTAKDYKVNALPIMVVILHDIDGKLGQYLAEYAVLEDINPADKAKYGNLIGAHREKLLGLIEKNINSLLKEKNLVTGLKEEPEARRLTQIGTELFRQIYTSPITFPFDGFNTANGNAAQTCHMLTSELLNGKLDYDAITAKPIKDKNRAITVLKSSWGIFNQSTGRVAKRPHLAAIKRFTEKWDEHLAQNNKIAISSMISDLCRPPFGCNIASAGLILGTYIAPRHDHLIIMKDGEQLNLNEWTSQHLFRGKYINLAGQRGFYLLALGEASSEWETLLDEWEQTNDYLSQIEAAQRALKLRQRQPLPPALDYRYQLLQERTKNAQEQLASMERHIDKAFSLIESGTKKMDVSLLAWGTSSLHDIIITMETDDEHWTEQQLEKIQPQYATYRQTVIQYFPDWLPRQVPTSDQPDSVAEFKTRMLKKMGGNLKQLGLDNELYQLEKHTNDKIKKAQAIADARQLLREVNSWINENTQSLQYAKVAQLRVLKQTANAYSPKLKGLMQRTSLPELSETRLSLSEFTQQIKQTEKNLMTRAGELWDTQIDDDADVQHILDEVNSLIAAFENLPNDLEDFQLMRKILTLYRTYHQRLTNESLSWEDFTLLKERMINDCNTALSGEEIPWTPYDVAETFCTRISGHRKDLSTQWITTAKESASTIATMTAQQANQLQKYLSAPPPVLTENDQNKLDELLNTLDQRLGELEVEWMVEKFKELSTISKKDFLTRIALVS